MSCTFYSLLMGEEQSSQVCPLMELHNLPYVVLRELIPKLGITEKQTLRLVSHRLRDLIDTQAKIHFNVVLSDATSSTFLKFNHFDLIFYPRILRRLNVTTLLEPLKISSTSSTRCPLPPRINTLAFSETRGVSQTNFLNLVSFYGKTDALKTVQINLLCLEKVESAKILRQGMLQLNLIQKLELVFPTSMDPNIECTLALLGGTFPSLQNLKIDLNPYGCYHPILYKTAFHMIARHLPGLITLEMLQPAYFYPPGTLDRLKDMFPDRNRPFTPHIRDFDTFMRVFQREFVQDEDVATRLLPLFEPDPETEAKFEEGCNTLKKLTLGIETLVSQSEDLVPSLVNCQKNLEVLELSRLILPNHPPTDPPSEYYLILPKILANCCETLVTLKLLSCSLDSDDDDADFRFDLAHFAHCSRLETFIFTWSYFGVRRVRFSHVDKLPQSLRHLELPSQLLDEDLWSIQRRLIHLKTFQFGRQMPRVTLAQFQILMGDQGIQSLEQVTLIKGFYESRPILAWARNPQNGLTITKVRERLPLNSVTERKQRDIVIIKRA